MQDKIKYVIFGLAAFIVLIVMMFLGLKVKSLEKERQDLQGQNTSLNEKITAMSADNAKLQGKIGQLSKDIEDVNAKSADVQKKYDILGKERDNLVNQISKLKAEQAAAKEQSAAAAPAAPVSAAGPTIDDSYLAGILKQKADLEVQISMMRETYGSLKAANDQLTLEKKNLTYEINNLNRDTQDVQHTVEYNKKMVDNLTQQLASEKTNNLELAKRLKAIKEDNRQMRQQLQSLGDRRLSLEKKVSELQTKNASLESNLSSMELYVKQQMYHMDDIKSQLDEGKPSSGSRAAAPAQSSYQQAAARQSKKDAIQLPPIVVRPQQPEASDAPDIGDGAKIISIDKENNFVVVNAGQADNLKIGDEFQVYRDGKNVGFVEVIQTRDRISACDIKNEKTPLRVGDVVR